jgi:CelD/BcsL family acetyltransferase involved in cellulose biosynthesis
MKNRGPQPNLSGVELIRGDKVEEILRDKNFLKEWSDLSAACPWSTACQAWEFAEAWFSVYQATHEPLLVIQKDPTGRLLGLLPLAIERASGAMTHVGAHQAEYQVWLATNYNRNSFIEDALDKLALAYPGGRLDLQYLPPGSPIDWCSSGGRWGARAILREKKRPLMALGAQSLVEESLRKKSNKSRINRLKRIGPLSLIEIDTRDQLAKTLDTIAEYCDLRQGAINASLPFRDDPRKKEFCLRLLEKPGISHVSALMLGDTVAAANIGLINRTSVSLGIVVHSPFLAEHSPGKILLLLLARELGRQGFTEFDLTPGGDMYKDRSADRYDQVHILNIRFSRAEYVRDILKTQLRTAITQILGARSQGVTAQIRRLNRVGMRNLATNAFLMAARFFNRRKTRYYAISSRDFHETHVDRIFNVNCISDLLCYESVDGRGRSKSQFLFDATQRLEAGDRVYTLVENGKLMHCAWISQSENLHGGQVSVSLEFPPNSYLLWEDYAHPDARHRGLARRSLEQRLYDAARLPDAQTILIKSDAGEVQAGDIPGANEFRYYSVLT